MTACAAIKPMSDEEIRSIIVSGNLKTFEGECPCPYSKDSKDKTCGDNSEYFKTSGKVLCYPQDISITDVTTYRQRFGIPDPKATQF